ncbi:MAG: bifunctional DNA primase/polymerase [Pseudonocardiaceae bacterium]
MFSTEWSDNWRGAFRIELRAEAIGLASRGWPVLPGTYPSGTEWSGPVPVHSDWQETVGATPDQVASWWTGNPYSLLVATGSVVDAVEVDAELGQRAAGLLRASDRPAPIVAMPNGKWVFLTSAGKEIPAELAARPGVRWHGHGSVVALPPTPFRHGVVHWRVKPETWGWQLPHAGAVHGVLARAMNILSAPTTPIHASAA